MSFLADLGNVLHSIGSFITGSENNQPNNNPTVVRPSQPQAPQQAPVALPPPAALPQNQITLPAQAPNQINLVNPAANLQRAPQGPQPVQAPQPAQVQAPQHASILHDITHNPITNAVGTGAKDLGSAGAGASLGVLRAGEGMVKGITDTPQMIADATTWGADKLSGATGYKPQFVKNIDQWTNDINQPQDWLAKQTDNASLAFGQPGADLYKPAQVAANVAALVPAGAAVVSKLDKVKDLGSVGDAANAVNNFVEGQKAASPIVRGIESLKGNLFNRPAPSASDVGPSATPATDPTKVVQPTELAAGIKNTDVAQQTNDLSEAMKANAVNTTGNAAFGDAIQQAYRETGIQDPYNLTVNALARMTNKADVRQVVQQLAGNSDANTINRLTKNFTKASTPDEVHGIINAETARASATPPLETHNGLPPMEAPPVPPAELPQGLEVSGETGAPAQPIEQGTPATIQTTQLQQAQPIPTGQSQAGQLAISPTEPSQISTPPHTLPTEQAPLHSPENTSSEPPITTNNVAPMQNNVNPTSGNTALNAPNVRAQAEKDLQALGAEEDKANPSNSKARQLVGNVKQHDVLSNEELTQAAQRVVSTMSDEELVSNYKTGATFNNSADLAQGKAALDRLAPLAAKGNTDAAAGIKNILDAAEAHVSESGRTLNYAQSMYDSMPKEAKTAYLVKSINASRTKAGLAPLSDAESSNANATIDHFLTEIENQTAASTEAAGKIDQFMADAKAAKESGMPSGLAKSDTKQITQLSKGIISAQQQVEKLQGDLVRAYDTYVPAAKGVTAAGDKAGNLGRSLMLTSVSGRLSDVFTTSINVVHALTQNGLEALGGKVANGIRTLQGKDPGKYIDKLPSFRAGLQGTDQGLRKAVGNYKGNLYSEDVLKAIKGGDQGGKTQLMRAGRTGPINRIRNLSHAMAETATNLSQGVKNTKILQQAYQEGRQAGLEGDDLHVYAAARAAVPTKQMAAKGEQLLQEVNNMNSNPISHAFSQVAKAADHIPVFGEQIRNLTVPFTQWTGGQMWNGLTDKNAVANIIKAATAAKRGDPQEVVHQLAGLTTNTVGTMSAGYALASAGVLTTKNAAGYNDDGLYIHIGRDYIPVSFLGFAAPGIVMGAATHQAFASGNSASVASKVAGIFSDTMNTLLHSYLNNTMIGGSNEMMKVTQDWLQNRNGTTGGDVGATAGADMVNQYIPAAFSDANSLLNNGIGPWSSPLNPTKEAALTKVTKGSEGVLTPSTGQPSKARDVPRSVVNQLINKVPIASQELLPRNPGVAAPTIASRITRGDSASVAEVNKAKAAQTQLVENKKIAAQINDGVPVYQPPKGAAPKGYSFDNTLNTAIQTGQYDKAIQGLQSELKSMYTPGPAHIPPSAKQAVQDHINQIQIFKDLGVDAKFVDAYSKITNTEWRAMGDPTSSTYNPALYQKLYTLDQALTAKGISGGSIEKVGSGITPKYSVKTSGRSGSSKASSLVKDNKIGSLPSLARENFVSNLTATPVSARIPQIKLSAPGTLIKPHTISVRTARGNYN